MQEQPFRQVPIPPEHQRPQIPGTHEVGGGVAADLELSRILPSDDPHGSVGRWLESKRGGSIKSSDVLPVPVGIGANTYISEHAGATAVMGFVKGEDFAYQGDYEKPDGRHRAEN